MDETNQKLDQKFDRLMAMMEGFQTRFTAVEGALTAVSEGLTALPERSTVLDSRMANLERFLFNAPCEVQDPLPVHPRKELHRRE